MLIWLIAAASMTAVDVQRSLTRDAQRLGQWTAFRKYADESAVMFSPQAVWAHSRSPWRFQENPVLTAPVAAADRPSQRNIVKK